MRPFILFIAVTVAVLSCNTDTVAAQTGAEIVSAYGYEGCIRLFNDTTSVILEPNAGGRVIEYSLDGVNVIYVDPAQNGRIAGAGGRGGFNPTAGRFDIGPENIAPRRTVIWSGTWDAEIIGDRAARLTSQQDPSVGVQAIREFRLAADSSHLTVTQTLYNYTEETKRYTHWSRTFATGGGICIAPLNPQSRYPMGYITQDLQPQISLRPASQPTISVHNGLLMITGQTAERKTCTDSYDGWMGYLTRNNVLFVKRFATDPAWMYGEPTGHTTVFWYDSASCEIEPMGPLQTILPNASASFSEEWWLFPVNYPAEDPGAFDPDQVKSLVLEYTQ